jgi:hypothetical protein
VHSLQERACTSTSTSMFVVYNSSDKYYSFRNELDRENCNFSVLAIDFYYYFYFYFIAVFH